MTVMWFTGDFRFAEAANRVLSGTVGYGSSLFFCFIGGGIAPQCVPVCVGFVSKNLKIHFMYF